LPRIALIVLCKDEEIHLPRLRASCAGVIDEVFVIDSYSTDRTVDIARSFGDKVLQHKFVNYAQQFQWALDQIETDCDWIMRLDADEYLEPALVDEIGRKLPELPQDVTGIILRRKHIFLDRFIRHGGRYPLELLRIWRNGCARIEDRWMDEHIVLLHGHTVTFENDFCDYNLSGIGFFIDKHNKYATREAIDVLNERFDLFPRDLAVKESGGATQAASKRRVKDGIYNRVPFPFGPVIYFLFRYFIQLGFLDGKEGFAYHFLQGLWYRMLVGIKIIEFQRAIAGLSSKEDIIDELAKASGMSLRRDS
jgi:glycosyltransferase involved in cell wall biosynthesis